MFLRVAALALLFSAIARVYAQEAFSDALPTSIDTNLGQLTPESAWLDLRQSTSRNSKTQNAPVWVEAVTLSPAQSTGDLSSKSVFRIRVAQPGADYRVLFFRLFFDDNPDQRRHSRKSGVPIWSRDATLGGTSYFRGRESAH